jgi:FHS family Na+ dependent glucose MFS transporter 1
VGRLLAIPLARRLRPRTVLLSDLLLACAGLTLILVGGQVSVAVWTGTFLVGLGLASVFPTVLTLAERRMTITGRVTSAFFVGANVGAMTLPWLIGQLFTTIGPQTTMMAILVDLLLALLILAVLLRQTPAPDTG